MKTPKRDGVKILKKARARTLEATGAEINGSPMEDESAPAKNPGGRPALSKARLELEEIQDSLAVFQAVEDGRKRARGKAARGIDHVDEFGATGRIRAKRMDTKAKLVSRLATAEVAVLLEEMGMAA